MRKQVVEVQCARCERVEYRDGPGDKVTELGPGQAHVFLAKVFAEAPGETDLEVKFEELCGPCKRTIRTMLEQIGKRIEGVSPDRSTKKEPGATKKKGAKGPSPNGSTPTPPVQTDAASKKPAARPSA
jgi:hypothetical protein